MKSLYSILLVCSVFLTLTVSGSLVRIDPRRLERQIKLKRQEDAWLKENVPKVAERLRQFRAQQNALRWWLRRNLGKSFGL